MKKEHENLDNEAKSSARDLASSENQGEEKAFSQDEMNKIIQKRLREQESKFEKQLNGKIEEAIEDFKRKSQLSEEELKSEELENQKSAFEQEKQAFEKEKTAFQMRNFLNEAGLNPELANLINSNDAESNKQIVEFLKKDFEESLKIRLEKELNEVLKGTTPKDTSNHGETHQPKTGVIAI